MRDVPAVEFVESQDDGEPPPARHQREPGPRRTWLAWVAAGVAAAVAIGVVAGQHPASRPAAGRTPVPSVSSTPAPAPSPSTLALTERLAFGPQTQSVLVLGNLIYGLTTQLVAVVQRDGGRLIARPTPLALATAGVPRLLLDQPYDILWTVAIGGTSIGSYDSQELATRDDQVAPAPIIAAAAYRGELWFVTDRGLYRLAPGMPAAVRIAAGRGLRALAADPARHRMLVVSDRQIAAYPARQPASRGPTVVTPLPFQRTDDVAVTGGRIWVAGQYDVVGVVSMLNAKTLGVVGPPVATGSSGAASFVTTYQGRLIITGVGQAGTMTCLSAATGSVLQTWPYRRGAVALNDRGLLLSQGLGIELRDAHDCLAG